MWSGTHFCVGQMQRRWGNELGELVISGVKWNLIDVDCGPAFQKHQCVTRRGLFDL
jgi:hypothetical protein